MPTRTTVRCTLELDPIGEKRVRELQDLYRRLHGEAIGLGQLFALLARWAIARGDLPSLEDLERGGSEPGSQAGSGAPEVTEASTRAATAQASPLARGRAAPDREAPRQFRPKVLEVVVSVVETGWKFVRTALGWTPVPAGALAGFLGPAKTIPLSNLRIAAIAAARRPPGSRYRPAAVERYLMARSGGYCEVRDCNRRAVAAHHVNRFAYDPSHDPDGLVSVCHLHHGAAQAGLFRNESQDPAAWEIIGEGERPVLGEADRQFLEIRGT